MHANKREEIEEVRAGDIAAAIGLKDTRTGDTLCDDDSPIILEAMKFPAPVIDVAIEPKTKADQDKLGIALQKLAEEDPTFRVHTDAETGQTIISGMGELHLEIIVDRMMREFKVDANVGRPQVAYRETIRKRVEKVEGKFIRQSGGKGQYGHVRHQHGARRAGSGLRVRGQDRRRRDPARVHRSGGAGDQGSAGERRARRLSDGRRQGAAGVRLVPRSRLDAKWRSRSRARWRSRRRRRRRTPCLLEPMMKVEVVCPEAYMGDVLGDLSSRRGKIGGMMQRGEAQVIAATVPLGEMFGYSTKLRSCRRGARSTRWSSRTTRKCRSPRPKRSSAR